MRLFFRFTPFAMAMLYAVMVLSSCASDNIHEGDDTSTTSTTDYIDGSLSSSIPAFPSFQPVVCQDFAIIDISDANNDGTMNATITIGAFDIYVNVINRTFSIGTMVIEDMECTQDADGFYSFSKSDTECQAGDYLAKINNIEGTYRDGVLALEMEYKLGTMPFFIKSVFSNNVGM